LSESTDEVTDEATKAAKHSIAETPYLRPPSSGVAVHVRPLGFQAAPNKIKA
jgi:hypothetical protein